MTVDPLSVPWRVGRKVGRTIYAQTGPEPSDDDVLIGVMDTPELAEDAVNCHNDWWDHQWGARP
jgi:hypothetical protein